MSELLLYLTQAPVNSFLVALNSCIFLYAWNARMGFEDVSVSYRRVVSERQFYRVLTAALTHLDAMHVLFNMGALVGVARGVSPRGGGVCDEEARVAARRLRVVLEL